MQKQALARQLGATVRQVQVWFQNKRQRTLAKGDDASASPKVEASPPLVPLLHSSQGPLLLPPTPMVLPPALAPALDPGPPTIPSTPSTAAVLQTPPTPPPVPGSSGQFGMRRVATVDSLADLADVRRPPYAARPSRTGRFT